MFGNKTMITKYVSAALLLVPVGFSFFLQYYGRRVFATLEHLDMNACLPLVTRWSMPLVSMGMLPVIYIGLVSLDTLSFVYLCRVKETYGFLAISVTWLLVFILTLGLVLAFSVPFLFF